MRPYRDRIACSEMLAIAMYFYCNANASRMIYNSRIERANPFWFICGLIFKYLCRSVILIHCENLTGIGLDRQQWFRP